MSVWSRFRRRLCVVPKSLNRRSVTVSPVVGLIERIPSRHARRGNPCWFVHVVVIASFEQSDYAYNVDILSR